MDRKETELRDRDSGRDPGGTAPSTATVDDAAKALELGRQGEQLYSLGRYEEAIHIWTRILFLDRGNREARQAIETAKRAIAERQRDLDLKTTEAGRLLEAGDPEGARQLLRDVLSVDPSHGEAVLLSGKLAALERRSEPPTEAPARKPALEEGTGASKGIVFRVPKNAPPVGKGPVGSRLKMTAFLMGAVLAFAASTLFLLDNWDSLVSDGAFGRGAGVSGGTAAGAPGPSVPDLSELHYFNGVRLFQQARYREALSELARVDGASPWILEARSLTVRIQERLLRDPIGSPPSPAVAK